MQIDEQKKKNHVKEKVPNWSFSRMFLRCKILLERDIFIASNVYFTFPILIK